MSHEDRVPSISNPFDDPLTTSAQPGVEDRASATLSIGRNAQLTLGEDALHVFDASLKHTRRFSCCGLLSGQHSSLNTFLPALGSQITQAIPYYNVLDASIDDLEVSIIHALPTSKRSVRPSYITYLLADKTQVSAAQKWVSQLLDRAYGQSQRRKRIKVLVNPFGGKGAAAKLYARETEPILKAARCEVDVEQTTHSGHAVTIAQELDIEAYDAVACCSGDGLPHEVFNGLAKQRRPRRALRKIAVTQIPCGTGNAMSLNLNGTDSPSLAALAVVKGVRIPFDLVSISQGEKQYLSFLSQSVGIVAESDLGTENIRWMGSARFTVGFLTRLLGKTVYPAEIAVKIDMDDKHEIRDVFKRTIAHHNATRMQRGRAESEIIENDEDDSLPELRYGTVHSPIPSDWQVADAPTLGNFYCGNMAWMSPDAPFFPCALPNDNAMDLVNIDGNIRRTESLKLLLSVGNNKLFDQPAVTYRKISGYRITPRLREGQREGFISIDGEKVPFEPFQAEIVGGLGTVLSKRAAVYEFDGPREAE